jgi:hypothetical protein
MDSAVTLQEAKSIARSPCARCALARRGTRAIVVNAAGSIAALREMIEGQILRQPGMVK